MKFIGLDIGSSSIKGAVLDLDRLTIETIARVPCPAAIAGLPSQHFELSPHAVVAAVQTLLQQLVAGNGTCEGIVSCSQMAGVVLVDRRGAPLTNYLSWRDQRVLQPHPQGGASYYQVLQDRLGEDCLEQLGYECKPGSALSLLFWLLEQGQLPADSTALTLGDYVSLQLGQGEAATEFTNALGALHLEQGEWHRDAFAKLELADLRWPRLCDAFQAIGAWGEASIPVYPAVGDHQCALAGTRLGTNELSINVSTGSQVSLLANEYRAGDYQVRPYFDRLFLHTLTHLPAGRSLNTLADLLSELPRAQQIAIDDAWPYINRAVAEVQSQLQVDLAFFEGPMGTHGSIRNITVDNLNVGTLFRAAFENMAENYRQCALRLTPQQTFDRVVLSGGLAQNCPVLRDLIAAQFACPTRVSTESEETLAGLLLIALVASGRCADLTAAGQQFP